MTSADIPAILAQGLTKRFGELAAVTDLSLTIRSGEIFGLVGPDGAGKTTTLRMLTGIMTPTAGRAAITGYDVVKNAAEVKDHLAYMSQRFGLYTDLTVQENIEFYADLYGVPRRGRAKRIDDLLDFSYMRPFKRRLAGQLSGGMKQKLQLVCALIHTPQVLLLDEPTNGVDPVSRRDFWRILYQLLKQDVAILVTTAYLDEAERTSRVGLLHHGRLLAVGTPAEVRSMMSGRLLSIRGPKARQINKILSGSLKAESINVFGDNVHVVCADLEATKQAAITILKDAGIEYEEMREMAASLEDVFVSVLKDKNHQEVRGEPLTATSTVEMAMSPPQSTGVNGPAVWVKDLTRRFGDFVAVNQISFEVSQGEIFGFLGPNGAGKSTTIRMLCGLLVPTSGQGQVAGLDIKKQAETIKGQIGYMSQKFSLYEDLTVEENINFYGGIYGLSGRRLAARKDWAITMSGLVEHRRILTRTLAAGFKQRLAMACAILHEPPIVFLDEPTSGVDPLSRRRFWDLIYDMADRGVTVFVTTHYMEESEYCDRLALIYRGKMIALGTPLELKTKMMQEEILDVRCPQPQDVMGHLAGLPQVRDVALFGAGLHVVAEDAAITAEAIKYELTRLGVVLERIEKIIPSMEDVFVSMIEEVDRQESNAA